MPVWHNSLIIPFLLCSLFYLKENRATFEIMDPRKQLRMSDKLFASQLRMAKAMFNRFLSHQSALGDSFLKSSKDFIN